MEEKRVQFEKGPTPARRLLKAFIREQAHSLSRCRGDYGDRNYSLDYDENDRLVHRARY